MARIRTIKPEFPQSESMGNVSREARLLFILLWSVCDDHGKARGSSRLLASLLYPYDKDVPGLIDGWFDELVHEGCVIRYEVSGAHFIKVAKWLDHQKIDRPSASKFPDPSEDSIILAKAREPSSEDQGSRTKEGTKEGTKDRDLARPARPREPEHEPASPGADAPSEADDQPPEAELDLIPPEPPDIKAAIFGPGLQWFMHSTGANESSSRSFLGQLISQHGEDKTAAVLMAAQRTRPVDPRGWMKRNIGGALDGPRPRNRQTTGLDGESTTLAGVSAAFARRSFSNGG